MGKIRNVRANTSPYILETIEDRPMFVTERKQEVIGSSDDLESVE